MEQPQRAARATKRGGAAPTCKKTASLQTCSFSADFVASEAPIANNAQGLPHRPGIARKSFIGAGMGMRRPDQKKPNVIATIIGFFTKPQKPIGAQGAQS